MEIIDLRISVKPSFRIAARYFFEMRLYLRGVYPRGEEGVFVSTATGDYKYCLFDLAAELADWATEPFIKLEIRIRPVAAE